jgi:predicted RNase H-like nuclease (RuvC/YqgF family)
MIREIDNSDVPAETICKWQAKEIAKLNQIIIQKKKVIERLRSNITLLLKDSETRAQITREFLLRERSKQISSLQKELHRVRESDRKILQTLLTYKLKEKENGQEGVSSD